VLKIFMEVMGRIQCAGRESSILQKIVPRFDSKTSGLY